MWEDLGISSGTAIIVLFAFYFIIKWGVKNGIKQYFEEEAQRQDMERALAEKRAPQNAAEEELPDISFVPFAIQVSDALRV